MTSAPERVAVVVPCRNEASRIAALLDAIRTQEVPPHHIVVIDTGSSDGTRDILVDYQRRYPPFPLTCLSRPGLGLSAALNVAIDAAHGDIIIRLDGHSRPEPDYVRRAVAALSETGAGVVGGVWNVAPGRPTRRAEAIACAVSNPIGAGDAVYRTARATDVLTVCDTVPFGCFRKTTWRRLGGFNESLLTNEDYEFNYRARRSGLLVLLDSRIRCTYFARGTLTELAKQYFRYGWWKGQLLRQHPRSLRWRQILPGALVPLLAALVVATIIWRNWLAPGSLTLAYGVLVGFGGFDVAWRRNRWDLLLIVPAVFAVVHWSWSLGLWVHLATGGRWSHQPAGGGTVDIEAG